MTAGEVDDFSEYSNKLEAGIRNKMAEILELENDPNLSTDDMAKIFQEKSDKGEVTSTEVIFLHTVFPHIVSALECLVSSLE